MIDITQILLIIIVTILTVILTLVGIQLYQVLKDFRKTIAKLNKVLDDSGIVSEIAAKQATSFSGFIMSVINFLSFLSLIRRKKNV